MRSLKFILLFICTLCCHRDLQAQLDNVDGYSVQQFTDENGLPQNSVNVIAPDIHGFIWLATEGGLVRYDGQQFFTFSGKNAFVSSSRLHYIIPGEKSDELLVVNDSRELIKLKNGNVVSPVGNAPLAAQMIIRKFLSREENRLNSRQLQYHRVPFLDNDLFLMRDTISFYVFTKKGLEFYTHGKLQAQWPDLPWQFSGYFLSGGNLYAYVSENRFAALINGAFTFFEIPAIPKEINEHKPIIFWQAVTQSAFIYGDEVLYKLEKKQDGTLSAKILLRGFDLEENNIISLHHDPETGNLFLGSSTEGLFLFKKHNFNVLTSNSGKKQNVFYAHHYYKNNQIISPQGFKLGTENEERWMKNEDEVKELERYSIVYSAFGRNSIWGYRNENLFELDSNGKILNEWKFPNIIHLLHENKFGKLWIALRHKGLYTLDLNVHNPQPVLVANMQRPTFIQQVGDKHIWLGAINGLYKIDVKKGAVDTIKPLQNMYVKSLYITDSSQVWGTIQDEGIFLYKNGKLTLFPLDKNGYLSDAHCIMEDNKGNFWISTNKGLFQTLKSDLLAYADNRRTNIFYFYYGKESGFNTNEFNGGCQPCGVKWENGDFSFPSLKGLVLFNPEKIKAHFPNKEIFFHQITLDGKNIPISDTLYITHNFERLTFYITTPYFGNPNNLQIEALLHNDGDGTWTTVEDNAISFTTLPYGTYTLLIRMPKGFGEQYTYKKITLVIPPAYWQTWWFIGLIILLFFMLIYVIIRFRLRYILKRNEELENLISQRTHDLSETVLALKQSESTLNSRSKLQQKIILAFSHDLRSPLMYLMITGQKLYKNIDQIPAKLAESIRVMFNSSFSMYHFTDNFLNYARIFFMKDNLVMEEIPLGTLVKEKIDIFSFIAQSKNIEILNDIPNDSIVYNNRISLSIIIHNILDNAIKYSEDGTVRLWQENKGEWLHLHITDTGMGMTDDVKKLYAEFFKNEVSDKSVNEDAEQGLGLQIVRELVVLSGGSIKIQSEVGVGTDVKLSFKKRH